MTQRTASSQAAWAILTEGVTDARVRAHRLSHLLNRAMTLVDRSEHKDHFYQVAGDILEATPKQLEELERSLDRTSYALAVMGQDFLKGLLTISDREKVDNAVQGSHFRSSRKMPSATSVVSQYMAKHGVSDNSGAPSAENMFFDNPEKREVEELAKTKALSNTSDIAGKAVKEMDNADVSVAKARAQARKAPPDVDDILKQPHAMELSLLNRFIAEPPAKTPKNP